MIPKAFRLVLKPRQPFLGQKHRFSWGMIIVAPAASPQWAIAISKRAVASAAGRNRLRRRLMQFLYLHRSQLNPSAAFYMVINRKTLDDQVILGDLCSFLSIDF